MKMTSDLFAFIDEYCQYGWRGYPTANKFYIWVPIDCLDDFIALIDFNIFEYGFIENCTLSKDVLCIELSYFVDDVRDWFPKEDK